MISKLDGAVTLLCKTESAYLEAKEFIKMLPDVCEILSNSGENGAVMKFCGTPKKPAAEVTFASAQETAKLILRAQNLPSEEFDRIYVDISHRIRHNFLYTAVFRKDGIPVSCACAHISGGDALISTVYTLWQHRKNGFAAEVLNFLCEKFADKNIFLMCERTLTEYYKKSGFSVTGGYNLESTLL
ncbi:MAG: hypothetical protein IJL87_03640 [Clostridia bacterium]|nr:hypothetical protein [Clostridia bacterium]